MKIGKTSLIPIIPIIIDYYIPETIFCVVIPPFIILLLCNNVIVYFHVYFRVYCHIGPFHTESIKQTITELFPVFIPFRIS